MATRVTDGARRESSLFFLLVLPPSFRAFIVLTKSEEKETLLAVYCKIRRAIQRIWL